MPFAAAIGKDQSVDAREAGSHAARQALEQLGRETPGLGLVLASNRLDLAAVMAGVVLQLGDKPILGLSVSAEIFDQTVSDHSVLVALLSGLPAAALSAAVLSAWQPDFAQDSRAASEKLLHALLPGAPAGTPAGIPAGTPAACRGTLLLAADGFSGALPELCAALERLCAANPQSDFTLAGWLGSPDARQTRSVLALGRQAGAGALAGVWFDGGLVCSVASAHGWQPVGLYVTIEETSGAYVRRMRLVDQAEPVSPAEAYGRLFGCPPQNWTVPPLCDLVRLYPLGIEGQPGEPLLVRSALKMESDSSLRMTAEVPVGAAAHLMVGSAQGCLEAARQAAQQALAGLHGARPVLALVLCDQAWRLLLQNQPGSELQVVRQVLGPDVPMLGGYVPGQLALSASGAPQILNQHIQIVLFGE